MTIALERADGATRRQLLIGSGLSVHAVVGAAAMAAHADIVPQPQQVNPEAFGAVGDGVADDTRAMQAALDHCAITGALLYFARPSAKYRITKSLRYNPHRHSISGGNATLSSDFAGALLVILGGDDVSTRSRYWTNATRAISGIRMEGPGLTGASVAIVIGSDVEPNRRRNAAHVNISNIVVSGFAVGIKFLSHSYLIRFSEANLFNCGLLISSPPGNIDAGENITFISCTLFNCESIVDVFDTDINFIACSLDYFDQFAVRCAGNSRIAMTGCHIESTSGKSVWFETTGVASAIVFSACVFVILTNAPFVMMRGISRRGGVVLASGNLFRLADRQGNFQWRDLAEGMVWAEGAVLGDVLGELPRSRPGSLWGPPRAETTIIGAAHFADEASGFTADGSALAIRANDSGELRLTRTAKCRPGDSGHIAFSLREPGVRTLGMLKVSLCTHNESGAPNQRVNEVVVDVASAATGEYRVDLAGPAPDGTAYVAAHVCVCGAARTGGRFWLDDFMMVVSKHNRV